MVLEEQTLLEQLNSIQFQLTSNSTQLEVGPIVVVTILASFITSSRLKVSKLDTEITKSRHTMEQLFAIAKVVFVIIDFE